MTDAEKIILQNIDPKFKYIARDKNGLLCVYEGVPYKGSEIWYPDDFDEYAEMGGFNHLFKSVSWEDEEPTLIEDLIKWLKR